MVGITATLNSEQSQRWFENENVYKGWINKLVNVFFFAACYELNFSFKIKRKEVKVSLVTRFRRPFKMFGVYSLKANWVRSLNEIVMLLRQTPRNDTWKCCLNQVTVVCISTVHSLRASYTSVFRYRWTKNGFPGLSRNGPQIINRVGKIADLSHKWGKVFAWEVGHTPLPNFSGVGVCLSWSPVDVLCCPWDIVSTQYIPSWYSVYRDFSVC